MTGTPLTDDELLMLQFEERRWKRAGAKDAAVRRRFGAGSVARQRGWRAAPRAPYLAGLPAESAELDLRNVL
jgi:hypothetical protein